MLYVDPAVSSFAPRGVESMGGPAREKAALQEFEHLFINQLLKEMRKSLPEGGLFPKSQQQQYFEELFDDHLAGEMARSGQFGIARQMEAQLKVLEEGRTRAAPRPAEGGLALHPAAKGLPVASNDAGIPLPRPNRGLPLDHGRAGLPLRKDGGSSIHPSKPINRQADSPRNEPPAEESGR